MSASPRFRESAAVVLVRDGDRGPETFWVRRGESVGYMPGFRAFIGGKVGPEDLALPFEDAAALDDAARAMRACAVREAFEEAGVLVALAAPADPAPLPAARRALLAGEAAFPELARRHGWRFRAEGLTAAGRWTTPPFASQRFDTLFFLAAVPEGQEAAVIPGELESGEWVRPADALARWTAGTEAFAAPILHVLRELERGGPGLAGRLARGPDQPRRIEIQWGIVLHPMATRPLPPATHTNAYLVGERDVALVDPGSGEPAELEALFALVDRLAAEGRRVRMAIATHHHPDHVGGLPAVRERCRVRVAAHRDAAAQVGADVTLADGDWIPLDPREPDRNLRVIHTPGHTRGHICLHHPRTGALLTGDHVPGGSGTVIVDPPEGDMGDYVASLEKLLDLDVRTLFPGHGSPQGGARRRIRGLIEHRLGREQKVLAALSAAPRPIAELVAAAYADTARELWPWAERSLLAHLLKLEREGRARRDGERWASSAG